MKNFIKITATLSTLSIILFACGGSTSSTLTRSGGASTRCTSDSDCASGSTCNVDWGTCVSPTETNLCLGVTCAENETCNSTTGACVAVVGCTSNADCASTEFCELYSTATEYQTCVTKKANGQPCHLANSGSDCVTSTLLHKTCDYAKDSICGIGWRADPSGNNGPYCESQEQCRDSSLYCDVLGNHRCYGKKLLNFNCDHDYECGTNHCHPLWPAHDKCKTP